MAGTRSVLLAAGFALAAGGSVQAAVVTIPTSALLPSAQYYTTDIGGGIGAPLVMTGGGSEANVGSSRNDDGYSGPIALGFTLNFFGNNYTQFWANNNGNISFTGGISSYTPVGPQGAPQPIISPFFADVDTTNGASGLMYLRNNIANQIVVTWDQVGYYNSHADKLDSFQLVLRGPDYAVPAGEGQIGFFWNSMQWETGDASGGSGGFGGTPAAVGFGDGQSNGQVLDGSVENGIAQLVSFHRLWFNLSDQGVPEPICGVPGTPACPGQIPEPATLALISIGLVGLALRRRRRSEY
jgi:hypothetical protein